MKLKWILYFTIASLVVMTGFGIIQKKSYTDVVQNNIYMDEINVAQISEKTAKTAYQELSESLPESPVILKVSAVKDIEHFGRTSRQLVQIQDIFAGEELNIGEEIYITFYRWSLALHSKPGSMERGFVNVMEIGEEYLIFIRGQVDGLGEKTPVYELAGESVVAPVFSYRTHNNKIMPMDGISTYVSYADVRDNEFFAASRESLDILLKLKTEMMEKYCEDGAGTVNG